MEINKQLFEDILSGKLIGKFTLRNGEICSSTNLCRNNGIFEATHPYQVGIKTYTPTGLYLEYGTSKFDIINFIPKYKTIDLEMLEYCRKDFEFMQTLSKAINNMNTLEIEIPEGKEIDWKESEKQNKIVLKDKQLTYGEVCRRLFGNQDHYLIESNGSIEVAGLYRCACEPNASEDRHQLECILAKNQLANVARYLNDGWKPNLKKDYGYYIEFGLCGHLVTDQCAVLCPYSLGKTVFKSREAAQQAIKILGEETVKLALEPLGI